MKVFGKICKIILTVLLSVMLVCNLYFVIARLCGEKHPKIFGISFATVISDSMYPQFKKGDMVFFKQESIYREKDIIIFEQGGMSVTHRVIEVKENSVVTQGDANNSPDPEVPLSAIHGKVFAIAPNLGEFLSFLTSGYGLLIIACVLAAVYLLPKLLFERDEEEDE